MISKVSLVSQISKKIRLEQMEHLSILSSQRVCKMFKLKEQRKDGAQHKYK